MILRVGNRFLNLEQVTEAFHDPENGELIVHTAGEREGRVAFHDEEAADLLAMLDAYSDLTKATLLTQIAGLQASLESAG